MLTLVLIAFAASTALGQSASGGVRYKPPFLPLSVAINQNGEISVSAEASVVTPIGTFSAFADVAYPSDRTLTIVTEVKKAIYRLGSDRLRVRLEGGPFASQTVEYDGNGNIRILISSATSGRKGSGHSSSRPKAASREAEQFLDSTYVNARYDYRISYPGSLLQGQGEAANGDGQRFLFSDGQIVLTVWGSLNVFDNSLRQLFEEEGARPNRNVTYKRIKDNWFVVSGYEEGRVFYQKTILNGDVAKTFRLDYPAGQKATVDTIVPVLMRSFRG